MSMLKNLFSRNGSMVDQASKTKAIRGKRPVTIVTPPHTLYLAHLLFRCMTESDFSVSINVGEYEGRLEDSFFIVLCPQVFKRLPKSFIAFQMEQAGTHWFNSNYFELLRKPEVRILDYSRRNLPFLYEKGIAEERIRVARLCRLPDYISFLGAEVCHPAPRKIFDVVFYGGINERRFKMLSQIDRHFHMKVLVGVFGAALYENILKSRLVINLHIDDGSPVESTRIFEALSLGVGVVSETSGDVADYPDMTGDVVFAEVGSVSQLIEAIRFRLDGEVTPTLDAGSAHRQRYEEFKGAVRWAASDLGWQ